MDELQHSDFYYWTEITLMQLERNTNVTILKVGAVFFFIQENTVSVEIYLKIRFLPWMSLH